MTKEEINMKYTANCNRIGHLYFERDRATRALGDFENEIEKLVIANRNLQVDMANAAKEEAKEQAKEQAAVEALKAAAREPDAILGAEGTA